MRAAASSPRLLHRLWRVGVRVAVAALFAYLVYHLYQGRYGLSSHGALQERIAALENELARLRSERDSLEHRVRLLRDASLDPDLLDEASLRALGLGREGDLLILLPENLDEAVAAEREQTPDGGAAKNGAP